MVNGHDDIAPSDSERPLVPDYRSILRTHGVNAATLTAAQLSSVINAMHAAHTAGYVAGYAQAADTPHMAHGI